MDILKILPAILLVLLATALQACRTRVPSKEPAPVLMVCEHGSVKSLMAASLFNQRAAERHLPFRAIARGVTPDASVPTPIAEAMAQEGFEVKDFVPARVSEADVAHASRVIAIGVEPDVLGGSGAEVSIETWSDVPAASVNYCAARASLKEHVDALLTELQHARTQ
jgi:hypothetical protein